MNFTVHYRLAQRDFGRPLASVGAMLPDLWRMVDRRVRPVPAPAILEGAVEPSVSDVLLGISHHFDADAAFHASSAFRLGERALAAELAAIPARRLPLFAHVTWEMCLDGALVRREGAALLSAFGRDVAAALAVESEASPSAAARIHHAARKGEPLPAGFSARVESFLRELAIGDWVAGYAEGATVAERLDGIRRRLGFERFPEDVRRDVATVCASAIARAEAAVLEVLALRV